MEGYFNDGEYTRCESDKFDELLNFTHYSRTSHCNVDIDDCDDDKVLFTYCISGLACTLLCISSGTYFIIDKNVYRMNNDCVSISCTPSLYFGISGFLCHKDPHASQSQCPRESWYSDVKGDVVFVCYDILFYNDIILNHYDLSRRLHYTKLLFSDISNHAITYKYISKILVAPYVTYHQRYSLIKDVPHAFRGIKLLGTFGSTFGKSTQNGSK